MYTQWTLCRIHLYGTKNTQLEDKQCNGTLKRKNTSFLNDEILSLGFSCPNVFYAIQLGVFCKGSIFRKGLIKDSMGTSHSVQQACLKHCN